MRLRNIPGSREAIAASEFVISEEIMRDQKGHWDTVFMHAQPLYLEIGMGKGRFIMEMAAKYPDRNFIGIEKYSSVLIRALEKRQQQEDLTNLLFLRMEAEDLTDVFAPGEVAGIYLNFSDPWPKDRHAKRRLPGREFLARYDEILTPDGRVEFKTDNRELFDFALEEARISGWQLEGCTYDLHADEEMVRGNIMTEYEERFSSKGNPICKMIISRSKGV
ncbi:MAG: tRNA (guanosine(46)-N7)-methyltransferase TrmB [Clostridiales bacterium]|nr:tRNA (guanosine(46)-N7)-methyltransferase TrmB [Clostridiales bacterium]